MEGAALTKKADTWMPLLVAKYLADTMHLSTEQHGGYLLLLMHAWMNEGALPADHEKLRRITRMSPKAWAEQKEDILDFLVEINGQFRQKRLDAELQRANANVGQRVEAGRASAAKRKAQREDNEKATSVATTVDESLQRTDQQTGRPTATPSSLRSETLNPDNPAPSLPPRVEVGFEPTDAARICGALRQAGIASVNSGNLALLALLDAGATEAELLAFVPRALQKGDPFAWLVDVAMKERKRVAGEASAMHRGAMPRSSRPQSRTEQRAETLAGLTSQPTRGDDREEPDFVDVPSRIVG